MTESTDGKDGSGTYEMMWDCVHCGTKKLLGLTHRHCPLCGAPQDADKRYFPADDEKVAVSEHVYFGKDVVCKYCNAYNSRNAKHCRECGSPAAEGADAQTRETEFHAQGAFAGERAQPTPATAEPRKKSKNVRFIFLGITAAVVGLAVVFFAWKREASFEVAGHEWKREVDIERFGPSKESDWCDQMPHHARELSRYRAVRKHEPVKVGEDCKVKKVDKGDGTFTEVKKCTPKYEKKPIEADKCDFSVDKWTVAENRSASGKSLDPAPHWPEVDTGAACTRPGCMRAGPKREIYTVKLRAPDAESTCTVSHSRWSSLAEGQRVEAQMRVIGGGLDCDSLK
jgi:ribosomal protein L40E/predicted nucleic acid-binding Zn ribbon protein